MKSSVCRPHIKRLFYLSSLLALLLLQRESVATELRMIVLDVGMGQSILLVENGHGLLVDSGLAEYAPYVLDRMDFYGVQTLDYLVFTHLHADHAGGYFQIRAVWPEATLFDNCHVPEELHVSEESSYRLIHTPLEKDPLRNCLSAGDTIVWQNHTLQVLWPTIPRGNNLNHNSLVLLLTTKQGHTVLLMGDVDKSVEKMLQSSLQRVLPDGIDIFVAAHHAAADSCDPGFLHILQPQVSMVSVGKKNPFGYPAEGSMAVLKQTSEVIERTDESGEICYVLNSETIVPCAVLK